jgi:DSF synthase
MNQHLRLEPAAEAVRTPAAPVDLPAAPTALHKTLPAGSRLFDLGQLDVRWDAPAGALWTYMTPNDRPNFNRAILRDFEVWQDEIRRHFAGPDSALKYIVLGSRFPGVWNLGGDLDLFSSFILAGDRVGLVKYGRDCVAMLYNHMRRLELPVVTIALIEGDALGGGFEAMLSFNVVVAERNARFGLPEIAFGLFPGMGAHCLLSRKLGMAKAEEMILSGRTYAAEEMHALGLVHVLAEPGEGAAAVRTYIERNGRRQSGHRGIYQASALVDPVTLEELEAVVEVWADSALCLKPSDLKLMKRLTGAQSRLRVA